MNRELNLQDVKKHMEREAAEQKAIAATTVRFGRVQLTQILNHAADAYFEGGRKAKSLTWQMHYEAMEKTCREAANLIARGAGIVFE